MKCISTWYLPHAVGASSSSAGPSGRAVAHRASRKLLCRGKMASFYGDSIVLEFLAGALIGALHQKKFTPQTWKSGGVFIVVGLLYWLAANELLFREIGDASYSIYIFHIFVLGILRVLWTKASLPVMSAEAAWTFMASAIVINVVVGRYAYAHIEIRLARFAIDLTRITPVGSSPT